MGEHIEIEFTNCFRLSSELAETLGCVWQKKIAGVNPNCETLSMTVEEATNFLGEQDPKDILCLGALHGEMTKVLNELESVHPDRFNKKTVFAKIHETDGGTTEPTASTAIFTTFDSSKGMERQICMVFDWTYSYWMTRIRMPGASYKILRNIFCVAASRGKNKIIFVSGNPADLITEEELSTDISGRELSDTISINSMFDFKYKEDVEHAFNLLDIKQQVIEGADQSDIKIRDHDELIDLQPCIGVYQRATYFRKYDIDKEIAEHFEIYTRQKKDKQETHDLSLDEKILYLIALRTKQNRYRTQVTLPLVDVNDREKLCDRLGMLLSPDEEVQVESDIPFYDQFGQLKFNASGLADVVKGHTVYEIGYTDEFSHEHFLVCASYMIAQDADSAYLWNVRNNCIYLITIPNRKAFMDAVATVVTKGKMTKYYGESRKQNP